MEKQPETVGEALDKIAALGFADEVRGVRERMFAAQTALALSHRPDFEQLAMQHLIQASKQYGDIGKIAERMLKLVAELLEIDG